MAKGAPVDVFASADVETMDMAAAQGLVSAKSRRDFARNGVLGGFQDGSEGLPVVMAEIGRACASGHHEVIVRNGLGKLAQMNAARVTIDGFDMAESDLRIALMAHDLADRHGNVG
jgi:hypothetical protein